MNSILKQLLAIVFIAQLDSGFVILAAGEPLVQFSPDGKQIIVKSEGITDFQGESSVAYILNGQNLQIGTQSATVVEPIRNSKGQTPFGEAEVSTITFGSKDSLVQYTLKIKRLKSIRAFTLQGVFHNRSDRDARLRSFDLLDTFKGAGRSFAVQDPAKWLVTPLMGYASNCPAFPLSESGEISEAATFYHDEGQSFLIGPVGAGVAYTRVEVKDQSIKAKVSMDNIVVPAGVSRESQEMIFCFEPVTTAIDIWTRWVAITHGARLHKGPVYGWCSWYDRTTNIDAAHVLDVTKTLHENPNVFGKGIVQIDDGYQKKDGDWTGNERFPDGMKALAAQIQKAGAIPGIWIAPLQIASSHPWAKENPDALQAKADGTLVSQEPSPFRSEANNWVNADHPKSREFLRGIIQDAKDNGFKYLKIDFNSYNKGSKFYDPTKTHFQVFRDLYRFYRETAGEEMYILACLVAPNRAVVGYADAVRIGPDSHPAAFAKCLKSVLRYQIYNNVWWWNDPDVSYITTRLASRLRGSLMEGPPEGEGIWRTWHAVVALAGGASMVSEPVNTPDAKEFWRNYEIMRPSSKVPARLLTMGTSTTNAIFGFVDDRPDGRFAVFNLYNNAEIPAKTKEVPNPVTEAPKPLQLDFKAAGMWTDVKYAVFDFWQNKVVGYATNSYTTAPIPSQSSALLRFTPLTSDGPVLVGSNLHLSIGATEIEDLRVSTDQIEVKLTDAGAHEGSLTFFSTKPLSPAASENCKTTSVDNLGDNLWRVNLSERQFGKPQALSLKVGQKNYHVESNIDYLGDPAAPKADLYYPDTQPPDQIRPAVVIIHGGGWIEGDKADRREQNIGATLASKGYVALSINYDLAKKGSPTWPKNLHQCKTAVRWLRKNATRLGIDPARIGVIGGSAGGHLAAMVGFTDSSDGLDPKEPYEEYSCKVQAIVSMYAPVDLMNWRDAVAMGGTRAEAPEVYKQATPINYLRKGAPPILILHGTADKIVDIEQSRTFVKALEKAGVEYQFEVIEGAVHTFDLQPPQKDLRPTVVGFFDRFLKSR